ncbi:hypothetical protein [Motilimonas sp. KMU-193]|uniref:hypothetical protein n=1 Tax=Motilimonas sp. KMU-193 TaxID=3388668 RepID=UPI00396B0FDD
MVAYIEQCQSLSLTARVCIALKIFERFCQQQSLHHSTITEFCDYLWQWPLIDDPEQFEPWESSRPYLVNFALGDASHAEMDTLLSQANISEHTFREIVGGIAQILWGSFWGACEDEASLNCLHQVILHSSVTDLPNLTPFRFSKFCDNSGWGFKLTPEDVTYWRLCTNVV